MTSRLILAIVVGWLAAAAQAQTFPARTIHIVAPYAAGGAMDLTSRAVAAVMSETHRPAGGGREPHRRPAA